MPDISDISTYFAQQIANIVYPNGFAAPSIVSSDVRIFEGWPLPEQLDMDLAGTMLSSATPPTVVARPNGPMSNISIFPMPGGTTVPYQIQDNVFIISYPTFGLSVSVSGNAVTVSGQPNVNEYLTIIVNRNYAYSATGSTQSAILNALLSQIQVNFPSASLSGGVITFPQIYSLVARQGGQGVLGKALHRQCHSFMFTVWAPTHVLRNNLAKAVDNVLKQTVTAIANDTSMMRIAYTRTSLSDEHQNSIIYRRDLIYDVDYATVDQFPGFVITTVNTSVESIVNTTPALTTTATTQT